jgi:HEAT repeat protein
MTDRWYYKHEGQTHGPATVGELHQLMVCGRLTPTHAVWPEGASETAAIPVEAALDRPAGLHHAETGPEWLGDVRHAEARPARTAGQPGWLDDVRQAENNAPAAAPATPAVASTPAEPLRQAPAARGSSQLHGRRASGLYDPALILGGVVAAGILVVAGWVGLKMVGNGGPDEQVPPPVAAGPTPETPSQPAAAVEAPPDLADVLAVSEDLKSADPRQRIAALLALGKAGPAARVVLPALIDALNDADGDVRQQALAALDRVGALSREDLPILSVALLDKSPAVRAYAASALASIGVEASDELPALAELRDDPDEQVRAEAEKAHAQLKKQMLAELTTRLKADAGDVRADAARQLGDLGPEASPAIANLTDCLADPNSAVRQAAGDALVQMGPQVVPVLVQALKDDNPAVRGVAIRALAQLGADAQEAVPGLVALTGDTRVGQDAIAALDAIRADAAPALVRALAVEPSKTRQQVLTDVLARIGPEAAPALEHALQVVRPEARARLAEVLQRVGPLPPARSLPKLTGKAGEIYADLRGLFDRWDLNHDGRLDRAEVERAFAAKAPRPGDRDLARDPRTFLARLDRDGDGRISREEYERWARGHAEKLHKELGARQRLEQQRAKLRQEVTANLLGNQGRAVQARQEGQTLAREAAAARRHLDETAKAKALAEQHAHELAAATERPKAAEREQDTQAHALAKRKARDDAQFLAQVHQQALAEAKHKQEELRQHRAQVTEALRVQQRQAQKNLSRTYAQLGVLQRQLAANQRRGGYQGAVPFVDRRFHQAWRQRGLR